MSADTHRDALLAELAVLRALLRDADPGAAAGAASAAAAAAARLERPSTLDEVTGAFGLSSFERAVLLLAAGRELVAAVAHELEAASGTPFLTFSTALATLPDAHWSAIAPEAPLRHWGLVVLDDPRSPTQSVLTVDERVLHHLVGDGHPDERLVHLFRSCPPSGPLPDALLAAARDLAGHWRHGSAVLQGERPDDAISVASAAADLAGRSLRVVAGADLPPEPADLARTVMLLERECRLDTVAWLVSLEDLPPDGQARLRRACAGVRAPLALRTSAADPTAAAGDVPTGRSPTVHVPALDLGGRIALLTEALVAAGAPTTDVPVVAGVFDLSVGQARDVATDVARGEPLWSASRRRSRVEPGGVARRVEPSASWPDLVLPAAQVLQLRALVSAVRHRALVLGDWGYARRSRRGLGTTALFTGASGTGKTLAAEVVAHELDLDLLHVDLSQVVSKYIGETEKNLASVFDAAERGSAVLLFDEADTLFGRRSEVKDSHDRYANLEVGYLLQRMEQFRGLAILTTNAKGALDQAFLRRLSAVVTFPYPDVAARARMWRIAFPPQTPTDGVDVDALALVDVPGGAIAAAALSAAYLAAADGGLVTTEHVRDALGWELAKSGRTVAGSPAAEGRARP